MLHLFKDYKMIEGGTYPAERAPTCSHLPGIFNSPRDPAQIFSAGPAYAIRVSNGVWSRKE
jgi:hypothetical protein